MLYKMDESRIPLYCMGVSYKQAPLLLRERLAFSEADRERLLKTLCTQQQINGAVLAVTCNRTELYYSGTRAQLRAAEQLLADAAQIDVTALRTSLRIFMGQDALDHLFHVTSGLDSMVVGEDEILGQMKNAYLASSALGYADYCIHTAFQKAFACAKEIKTKTCLSKTSVSVAALCAKTVHQFAQEHGLQHAKLLLIGASGETGSLVAKNLKDANIHIYATKRRHQAGAQATYVSEIPYETRYAYMEDADIVVSATKSPHYVLTRTGCEEAVKSKKVRLFIDLAVPSDLDPALCMMENVRLMTIDDFEAVADAHNMQKKDGMLQAEELIESAGCEAKKEFLYHAFLEKKPQAEQALAGMQAGKLLHEMKKNADEEELAVVLALLERMY